jgi:HSP20 family protein
LSSWDRDLDEWIRGIFSGRIGLPTFGRGGAGGFFGGDMPRQFDEMRQQMERMLEDQFKRIESTAPKNLVKEYQTPEGAKIREVGNCLRIFNDHRSRRQAENKRVWQY